MSATRREVGCTLAFNFLEPSVLALQLAPPVVQSESLRIIGASEPFVAIAANGGRTHIIEAPAGRVDVSYEAECSPHGTRVAQRFDDEVLVAGRQSRYCPSDQMADYALREFSADLGADDLADRIATWVFERIAYEPVSGPSDSALDTLLAGRGVCRDFAHLTITLCRALNIPSRLASVYAPGVTPMDFHAVVEVWRRDRWEVLDPTRLAPRSSLVRIATGRDAADTAFAATISGDVELLETNVFAVVDGSLPADDHVSPATLA